MVKFQSSDASSLPHDSTQHIKVQYSQEKTPPHEASLCGSGKGGKGVGWEGGRVITR